MSPEPLQMERTLSKLITYPVNGSITDALPSTIAGRTRRVYDALSLVYPMSTFFFHSKAHEYALEVSGIRDGMRVLEVATGSGEMFHRLVAANPSGSHHRIGSFAEHGSPDTTDRPAKVSRLRTQCEAVDARYMPFRDESFDAVMCCYLLELLSGDDIVVALQEIYRVLRRRGTFTLVLIGQNTEFFNQAYRVCGSSRLRPSGDARSRSAFRN